MGEVLQPGNIIPTEDIARQSLSKNIWIKLGGPAAGYLTNAFYGSSVAVLQEKKGAKREKRQVTTQAEDTAQTQEKWTNKIGIGEVAGKITTERITPETVSPTMIVMTGTAAGEKKCIKVLKAYRIVLLGDTRAEKSSLANTIFGEDVFKIDATECQAESKSIHGRRITLINTPDFFDLDRSEEELKSEILRSITDFTPRPHAFVIVLKVEESTEQQQAVIKKICQYFSEEVLKYATVVFTHEVPEGNKTKEFVDQNKCLSDLVRKCRNRCHVMDNKDSNQVAELLNTIDQIVIANKGGCYTSEMLLQGDTSNKASNHVCKNGLIKFTGPAAESVADAFFGPAIVVLTEGTTNGAEEGKEAKKAENEGTATGEEVKGENEEREATSDKVNEEPSEEMTEEEDGETTHETEEEGQHDGEAKSEKTNEKEEEMIKEEKDNEETTNETEEREEGQNDGEAESEATNERDSEETTKEDGATTKETKDEKGDKAEGVKETIQTKEENTEENIKMSNEDEPPKETEEREEKATPGTDKGELQKEIKKPQEKANDSLAKGKSQEKSAGVNTLFDEVAGTCGIAASGTGALLGIAAAGAGAVCGITAGSAGATVAGAAGAGSAATVAKAATTVAKAVVTVAKAAATVAKAGVGAVGVTKKICQVIGFVKELYHNLGVIALVFVFFSLILAWFFLKVPFVRTLLLLLLFLLLIIILAVIEL